MNTCNSTWKCKFLMRKFSLICEKTIILKMSSSCDIISSLLLKILYHRLKIKIKNCLSHRNILNSHVRFSTGWTWMSNMWITPLWFDLNQNFKNNNLLSHESEVNKLQEEGDRLVEMKHPASAIIQVLVLTQTLLSTEEASQVDLQNRNLSLLN